MPLRNVVATAAAIVLAWLIAGCGIAFEEQSSTQLDVIGDVEVRTAFCVAADFRRPSDGCETLESDHRAVALVGYRIPDGTGAPSELVSSGDVELRFARDDEYTAALESWYPQDGARWVGYRSQARDWRAGDRASFTVAPRFALGDPPFTGPFEYTSVGGYAEVADDSEPLACDDPGECAATGLHDGSQPTRDLVVEPGSNPGIPVLGDGDVPVGLRFAGAAGDDARFALSATTDLPGASVSVRDADFAPPSDSLSVEPVHVVVPGDAEPGLYRVTLTARSGTEVRSGTTEFIVTEKVDPGVALTTVESRQLDVIGDVEIAAGFCTKPDPRIIITRVRAAAAADCGASGSRQRTQPLAAFRVPEGSSAPASFGSFSRDPEYGAWLDEHRPPPPGQRWVGYRGASRTVEPDVTATWEARPRFGLPTPGKPYEGPYPFAVAGGYRDLARGGDPDAPVDCAAARTACVEDLVQSEQPTRDLGVLPGGEPPEIVSGTRGTVPFDLRFAGAGGAEFDLAAASDVEGASAVPGRARFAPRADAAEAVGVTVDVPAGTPPGTYAVELAASPAGVGSQRRGGTMAFRVVAPGAPEPEAVEPLLPNEPAPGTEPAPRRPRPRLALILRAAPQRAYTGARARYRIVARNVSARAVARHVRVCQRLPGRVQYAAATRRARFRGRDLCFAAGTLRPGRRAVARVYVRVNRDARPGRARARAVATAANARPARARASLRVVRRAQAPRPAPVTG